MIYIIQFMPNFAVIRSYIAILLSRAGWSITSPISEIMTFIQKSILNKDKIIIKIKP